MELGQEIRRVRAGDEAIQAGDAMSVRGIALQVLIFVAVIVAISAVGIWLDLGAVVE